MRRVCIYPKATSGGVGSFRLKFAAGLEERGIEVSYDLDDVCDLILVLAGTRNLNGLWRAKKRGIPIVQRLDGINWIQRKRWAGLRYTLRAEYGNWNLSFIRRYLADKLVYQSEFVRGWWLDWYGKLDKPYTVIHNGVDLDIYTPQAPHTRPIDRYRLLVVEGSLIGGLDFGLDMSVQLAEALSRNFPIELAVVGGVSPQKQADIQARSRVPVEFIGSVPRENIPEIDRSAHLFFSAEVNPPCPNAVIEALACGLPVVGFDTGSLKELIPDSAGLVVPYGGNVWKLDKPDTEGLAEEVAKVLENLPQYQHGARAHAESALGLDKMVDTYLSFLK